MRITVALGGNALLKAGQEGTVGEQLVNLRLACRQLVELAREHDLVITHGNGPQVGKILLQNEMAADQTPAMPLDVCGAMSQGQIGYLLQQELHRAMVAAGSPHEVVTLITRVLVDPDDPSFQNPTKPIGSFYSAEVAAHYMKEKNETWIEDSGRGWRKVVPSPQPQRLLEEKVIKQLVQSSCLVIASGGGGIPVVEEPGGGYQGIEAVIDKDLAAALLADAVESQLLLILTDVPGAYLHYGTPNQQLLGEVTIEEIASYAAAGHFAAGSMGPKVEAAIRFVSRGKGRCAIITALDSAIRALQGKAGTRVVAVL